ncbi:hypothetical protein [Flavobacterium cheniae]|uniref:GLPGLI family protein n=1 Tax=Flavobacterium cheniae TaxID=295428 RepID=A0A562KRY5_9FLAO|nr:hypothetical protein [Flavobacterium cheniae]TDR25662.1 hypothetical protein C8D80_0439 [Flavobacterium cheniae]TWH98152.1 hypothetical protein IP97_00097 [Flavobacterium cheniae]
MNKILLLVIITLTHISGFSQDYKFNKLFTYQSSLQKEPRNVYCNSIDKNIFLEIRNDVYGLYASLTDLNKNEYHRFKIDTTRVENNLHLNFIYEYTNKIKTYEIGNQTFEYEIITEDSIQSKGFIKIYKDKKKKKMVNKHGITVLKGDINYFNIYRFMCIHPYENSKNLNIEMGGIVKSTTFFNGEINVTVELNSVDEANINVVVPDNKIIKTFSF